MIINLNIPYLRSYTITTKQTVSSVALTHRAQKDSFSLQPRFGSYAAKVKGGSASKEPPKLTEGEFPSLSSQPSKKDSKLDEKYLRYLTEIGSQDPDRMEKAYRERFKDDPQKLQKALAIVKKRREKLR